jgi:hypothetical protein
MSYRAGLLLCMLTMLFAQTVGYAQRPRSFDRSEAEAAFNAAAGKYGRTYRGLGQSRGVDLSSRVTTVSHQIVASRLRSFYPERTALLFYDYEQTILSVWLVNADGIQSYRRVEISLDALESAASNLRKSLNVDALQALRAPRPRRQLVTPVRGVMLRLRLAIARLSALLLPRPISRKLGPVKHLVVIPALGLGSIPFAVMQPQGSS